MHRTTKWLPTTTAILTPMFLWGILVAYWFREAETVLAFIGGWTATMIATAPIWAFISIVLGGLTAATTATISRLANPPEKEPDYFHVNTTNNQL